LSDILEEDSITNEYISNIKSNPTKASFFIKNMLGYNLSFWDEVTYLNTYISTDPNYMYVCFLNEVNPKHTYMMNAMVDHPDFISKHQNQNFIICKFTIPIKFTSDFYRILDGKYSETTEDYKDLILRLNAKLNRFTFDKIKNGLYVTKSAIKELEDKLGCNLYVKEVISKPYIDKETFNPNTFNFKDGEI
jgi:hypothetical protein